MDIILASSSPFRKELLNRLNLPFHCISPAIDETHLENETAVEMVKRLSELKADAVAKNNLSSVVIASDQCAVIDGQILGKPGNFETAFKQLSVACGKTVQFNTGLTVCCRQSKFSQTENIQFDVTFRDLTDNQITHYLHTEEPYNCAGSFKSEAYGIVLFEKMTGDDPTALMGLPLIRLVKLLEAAGVKVV